MTWQPMSEARLWGLLNSACARMSSPQRNLWERIKIEPEKWQQHPYGDLGGGFWIVAILGHAVVWCNDIEDGFNRSQYSKHGAIDQYWCNQDELDWVIQYLLDEIKDGVSSGGYSGPPQAMP